LLSPGNLPTSRPTSNRRRRRTSRALRTETSSQDSTTISRARAQPRSVVRLAPRNRTASSRGRPSRIVLAVKPRLPARLPHRMRPLPCLRLSRTAPAPTTPRQHQRRLRSRERRTRSRTRKTAIMTPRPRIRSASTLEPGANELARACYWPLFADLGRQPAKAFLTIHDDFLGDCRHLPGPTTAILGFHNG
ncbi:hypothetical protein CI238_08908, partial [Colletotrichum incanum]